MTKKIRKPIYNGCNHRSSLAAYYLISSRTLICAKCNCRRKMIPVEYNGKVVERVFPYGIRLVFGAVKEGSA